MTNAERAIAGHFAALADTMARRIQNLEQRLDVLCDALIEDGQSDATPRNRLEALEKAVARLISAQAPVPQSDIKEGVPAKNPGAVSLGRLGGVKGGAARAANMSAEERASAARHAARSRWERGGFVSTPLPMSWEGCVEYCRAHGLKQFSGDMTELNAHRKKSGRDLFALEDKRGIVEVVTNSSLIAEAVRQMPDTFRLASESGPPPS